MESTPIPWPPENDGKSVWVPFRYRGRRGIETIRSRATGRPYRFGSSAGEQVKWVAGEDAEQLAMLADFELHPTLRIDWAAEAQQREAAAESAKAEEALERKIQARIAEAEADWREAAVAEASRRQKPVLDVIQGIGSEVEELKRQQPKKRTPAQPRKRQEENLTVRAHRMVDHEGLEREDVARELWPKKYAADPAYALRLLSGTLYHGRRACNDGDCRKS